MDPKRIRKRYNIAIYSILLLGLAVMAIAPRLAKEESTRTLGLAVFASLFVIMPAAIVLMRKSGRHLLKAYESGEIERPVTTRDFLDSLDREDRRTLHLMNLLSFVPAFAGFAATFLIISMNLQQKTAGFLFIPRHSQTVYFTTFYNDEFALSFSVLGLLVLFWLRLGYLPMLEGKKGSLMRSFTELSEKKRINYAACRRYLGAVIVILLFLSIQPLGAYIRVAPDGIGARRALFTGERSYGWNEVRSLADVQQICPRCGAHILHEYRLEFTDGRAWSSRSVRSNKFNEDYEKLAPALQYISENSAVPIDIQTKEQPNDL